MSSSTFSDTGDRLSVTDFLDYILVNYPPQTPLFFSNNGNTSRLEPNPLDEIKNKRKISNRESARRSRMRKQKHLEDVKNQVTRYKMVNHQLMNRLRFVNHNVQIVVQENQRLVLESLMLEQKLHRLHRLLAASEIHHTLLPSAWPCSNNAIVVNDQNQPSLVTL